jgi:MFS transporter, putative metabolite:H+ symporter
MKTFRSPNFFHLIVAVAALGYFVDIYDLILFGIVKNKSLMDLGINSKEELFREGNFLLSMQMAGMLLGGIIFGILGDKRGRLATLFLTITLYSIANIANGFVTNTTQYAWLRFFAGFGLSGELGIGITLVSEILSKESRGMGASFVSGIGIAGSALAFMIAEKFNWRIAYWSGGGLGLLLLFLRVAVYESGMYEKVKVQRVHKGDFLSLFKDRGKFRRFLLCILVAIPAWYTVSVLAINSSSMAETALHISGTIRGSTSVMWHYIGASIGSFLFGWISMRLKSRKKALIISNIAIAILTGCYFCLFEASPILFYMMLFLLGIPMGGLWAIFITTSSEQFGTNLRATVTTSTPNFVRGATILITFLLGILNPFIGLWSSGVVVGAFFIGLAIVASFLIDETYGKELDYMES